MSNRTLKLLHVEDDPFQHKLIAHHLQALPELAFDITAVVSEDDAMASYRSNRFDMIVLDYQLTQGNGLHLLQQLRALDPVVPIIAVSGVATSEVAAELVQAGADDYFDKRNLTSANLAKSVRAALIRADTVRKRSQSAGAARSFEQQFIAICQEFARKVGVNLATQLETLEKEARNSQVGPKELEQHFVSVCDQIQASGTLGSASARTVFRPLMLDLLVRLMGDKWESAALRN